MEVDGLRAAGELEVVAAGAVEYRCPLQSPASLPENSSRALATPSDLWNLNILTPPPSDEAVAAARCKGETPNSHHTTCAASTLPREFKRKCSLSVYCDETATTHLGSLKEEPEEGMRKTTRSSVFGSPKKKLKTCVKTVLTSANVLGQELKENSPIKVDIGTVGGLYANKTVQPRACILKPLPFKLSRLSNKDEFNDILTNLRARNMLHVIDKVSLYLPCYKLALAKKIFRLYPGSHMFS